MRRFRLGAGQSDSFNVERKGAMSTIQQLVGQGRESVTDSVESRAMMSSARDWGVCIRIYMSAPKNPSSDARSVARVRLATGSEVTAYFADAVPSLAEHSVVWVHRGRVKDSPEVRYIIAG